MSIPHTYYVHLSRLESKPTLLVHEKTVQDPPGVIQSPFSKHLSMCS